MFTSLGFYPVAPGSSQYVIGRPFVERAALTLPNGKQFVVSASGLGTDAPYVASVSLNGKPLDRVWISHEEIMAGGTLHFTMSATPNKNWGGSKSARPYSMSIAR